MAALTASESRGGKAIESENRENPRAFFPRGGAVSPECTIHGPTGEEAPVLEVFSSEIQWLEAKLPSVFRTRDLPSHYLKRAAYKGLTSQELTCCPARD